MADTIPILVPYAEQIYQAEPSPVAPRLESLRGKTIGFIDNAFVSTGIIHHELQRLLAPYGITAITAHKKYWRPLAPEQIQDLAQRVDAVIGGVCTTPPSTSWGARDSIDFERRGKPTVTLATAYYEELLSEIVASEGMPELRRVILPFPLEGIPEESVYAAARKALEHVVSALTQPASETVARLR